ncbi:BFH_HP2_G0046930.mRNA.1.CDS.1 [Saccharomyces cerevisiae]|nr:BFH_HP2_G0046930.mRNA.1.CDS.1 [Saccharomyces cerevisiae]CAI6750766.1 BFH_HP2_G0046930.mRNA.1.CDS.1 [Saccharomyces cerevisiae]
MYFQMRNRQNQKELDSILRGLLSIEERENQKNLRLELVCMQAANSIPHDPIGNSSLETEWICLTTNTKDCKPVRFHSDLLLKRQNTMKLRKYLRKFWKTLEAYRDEFTKIKQK